MTRVLATPGHRRGVAAIEFALVAPLLFAMLAAVVEIGMASYQAMQVQAAAEAGAMYAAKHGATNLTAVANAATSATGTAHIAASATAICGCPTVTGVVFQGSDCTTVCAADNNSNPGQYVRVNATLAHVSILPFALVPNVLTATTTVRVK